MKRAILFFLFGVSLAFGKASIEKKKVVFIVNPIAHEIKNRNIEAIIKGHLDKEQYEHKIVYTEGPNHATLLAKEAIGRSDIIVAVGGDGTVNEVGKALVHTEAILGIIPVGSGNGLARHLSIPVGLYHGIKALNRAEPKAIDSAKINDTVFFNIAGIGFDALIADKFSRFGKRGLSSYAQVTIKEFQKYEPQNYHITIDNKPIDKKAFILAFANSSQYGNDFYIAPKASTEDGFLDLIIIDDIPPYYALQFLQRIKQNTLDRSAHFERHPFKTLTLDCPHTLIHIDGEVAKFNGPITITTLPHSLRVMVPQK
ncbi:MAG: diacylglycerol kinase family lipid kinase [Simkaniaceae bacterium]|nr:diacylglycerol kinase family lipid kinase [Simkaniaceae bacterium]